MAQISHTFYAKDYVPYSTVADVEDAILNRKTDEDGISNWDWANAIMTDDTPHQVCEYILMHKNNPVIKPLYDLLRADIESILDN
jgi:hypothetical protein